MEIEFEIVFGEKYWNDLLRTQCIYVRLKSLISLITTLFVLSIINHRQSITRLPLIVGLSIIKYTSNLESIKYCARSLPQPRHSPFHNTEQNYIFQTVIYSTCRAYVYSCTRQSSAKDRESQH